MGTSANVVTAKRALLEKDFVMIATLKKLIGIILRLEKQEKKDNIKFILVLEN